MLGVTLGMARSPSMPGRFEWGAARLSDTLPNETSLPRIARPTALGMLHDLISRRFRRGCPMPRRRHQWLLAAVAPVIGAILHGSVHAQVVHDGTVGTGGALAGP